MVERVSNEPEGASGPSNSDDDDEGKVHSASRTMPVKEVFYVP